ncbi:MAG: paraquat-inducible protein A [Pseudomonadota bacterium]
MRARDMGIAVCQSCQSLIETPGTACPFCGAKTAIRKKDNVQKVWAFWIAGVLAYIPGNVYPIMVTESFSGAKASTIVEGVSALLHHGSYAVAIVVFVASIVVPVAKFVIIAWLALTVQFRWQVSEQRRIEAYEVIEFIGRWSMVDVFVVAALAALIQVGGLMSVKPGIGINAFALSVMFTMLSAMSFDSRGIWDAKSE